MSHPERSYRIGNVTASVFKNEGGTSDGETREFRTVSLQRRYRTDDGWKSSTSFSLVDLPAAVTVMQRALEYILEAEGSV